MTQYELLDTLDKKPISLTLNNCELPELVHLDDPALDVMRDYSCSKPQVAQISTTMDDAHSEMKITNTHLLVVIDENKAPIGVVTSEDILGEKPIKLIQEDQFHRNQITVKMLMTPIANIPAFAIDDVEHARVGNIVNTLKSLRSHFALVIENNDSDNAILRGVFNTSQISKQLHTEVASTIAKAQSVSELSHRTD
jgi:CBS-domain-containing membrane protein